MSIARMAEVWKLDLPTSPKMVLLALADCANDDGSCWPSMATIAAKASMSLRTAQGCIKILVEGGFLERDERAGKGCFYTVLPRKNCTPAKSAPPQKTTRTPADSADKPSRTVNRNIKDTRVRAQRDAGGKDSPDDWASKCPEWADPDVWRDFLMNRKAKRIPNTETAYRGLLSKAERLSAAMNLPPGEILRHCTEEGWAGLHDWTKEKQDVRGRKQRGNGGGPACGQFDGGDGMQSVLAGRIAARRSADGDVARSGEYAAARLPALRSADVR